MNTITFAPTIKQLSYIRSLITKANGPDNAAEALLAFEQDTLPTLDRAEASHLIDTLIKATPAQRPAAQSPAPDRKALPAGRYALTDGSETRFYQVDRPTRGRWDGSTFVNEITASGTRIAALRGTASAAVLARLATNPHAHAVAYGRHTGTCSTCHRTLTDPDSIAAGIGPVCAKKF